MLCLAVLLVLCGTCTASTVPDPFAKWSEPVYQFLRDVVEHMRTGSNISRCRDDFESVLKDAANGKMQALQIFDSMGKPGSGVLEGGVSYVGVFSECTTAHIGDDVYGKYCLVNFQFDKTHLEKNNSLWPSFYSNLKIGICVPSTCSYEDILNATGTAAWKLHPSLTSSLETCHSSADDPPIDGATWFVICLFVVFLLLGVMGSILDVCDRPDDDFKVQSGVEGPLGSQVNLGMTNSSHNLEINNRSSETLYKSKKIKAKFISDYVRAFSLVRNIRQILNTDQKEGTIQAIHGIRFLSMAWIITGHSFSFALQWLFFRNPSAMTGTRTNILSQGFANGTFAVDTFFFLGGFLMAYIILKRSKRNEGKFNIFSLYLHRYIRMTPLMMCIIAFTATVLRHLGSGPAWPKAILMYDGWCRKNWWLNLLYVQNFFDMEHMCLSHTWYSAIDMQLFLVAPVIMKLCLWNTYGAISGMAVLFVATSLCPIILTLVYHLPAVANDNVPLDVMNQYYWSYYIKPYCRMGPYLVGIALAYYLYRRDFILHIPKKYLYIGWTLSIAVNLVVIYSMGRVYTPHPPTDVESALYNGLARTAWAVTIAWLTLTCITGQAGILDSILSWNCIVPLSRLTYSAYLIHPVIMALFYGTKEQMFDFSVYWMVYLVISNMAVTYIVSLILSALFEFPITNLERLYKSQ